MTSLCHYIVTAEQKHLLLIGYIHRSCHTKTIPCELIEICSKFLDIDGSIEWNLSGSELQQFLSAKNGDVIIGPSFTMHQIKFNLFLTPNGINASEQGYVQFLASPTFTSSNIHSITIWYSLCCTQTNSEWNNSTTFDYNDSDVDCASWPVRTLPLQDVIEYCQLKHNDSLQFNCYIDILNIEYMDDTPSYYSPNERSMNRYAKFQWDIYDELLTQFRYCVCGKYYFKHINANWMLETAPNGQTEDDEGSVNVLLSLLRLPKKVSAVVVHMVLYCDYNDITWDLIMKFDYESNESYGWPEFTLLSSNLLGITSITFTVQISILEVYDKMGDEVPYSEWHLYGIIDNTKELEKQFDLGFKQRHKAKLESQERMIPIDPKTHSTDCIKDDDENELTATIDPPKLNRTGLFVELLSAASHFM